MVLTLGLGIGVFALTVTLATFGPLLLSFLVAVAVPLQRVLRVDPAVSLRTS